MHIYKILMMQSEHLFDRWHGYNASTSYPEVVPQSANQYPGARGYAYTTNARRVTQPPAGCRRRGQAVPSLLVKCRLK